MKTQNKRAQSAVEYLMTYGWAILVIIVVGAALWKLGVFDVSKYTGSAKLAIADFTVAGSQLTTTTFTAKMGPNQRITLDSFNILIANSTGTISCTPSGVTAGSAWPPSDEKTLTCSGLTGLASGTSYQVKVNIGYTDASSFAHVANATYNPKAE